MDLYLVLPARDSLVVAEQVRGDAVKNVASTQRRR